MPAAPRSLPVTLVAEGAKLPADLTAAQRKWARDNGFSGALGKLLALPGDSGVIAGYLFGLGKKEGRPVLAAGLASASLPAGRYRLEGDIDDPTRTALAFRLGAYRFDRYRQKQETAELVAPKQADATEVDRLIDAASLARDLINTPASDLGPDALEQAVRALAKQHGAKVKAITGDNLLKQNFPMIHAVGRAAHQAPRLLDVTWGKASDPKVTLVGKGVTFDTGGLNIKPGNSMLLMKKDMGGAANVLGLAHAVMDAGLRVRLRVLVPIVENAISASSFRPGDVLTARDGTTVEIGNTDAEGRLVLADALCLAGEEQPELVVDMATLTGAARAALGPDLPPAYVTDDALADSLMAAGAQWGDPLWRMPLWAPYESMITSRIADVNNAGQGGFAGSVTAALFLQRFARGAKDWVHLDIYGWAPEAKPGRSFGGTDQGIRAVYAVLKQRYS